MGRFIPSRLVAVRSYAASFSVDGAAHPARADCRVLRKHGIDAQVKGVFRHDASLMVPEHQYERAKEILSDIPDLFSERDIAPKCPQCRTEHPFARPPYAVAPGLAGLILGIVVVRAGYVNAALAIVALGVVIAAVVQAKMPQWQCRSCGRLFRDSDVHAQ